jgi:RNA polymerase sigma-70 factor, ECF subfamily
MKIVEVESVRSSDYELARKAAGGDLEAFEILYSRHFQHVYALCLRITANPTEAEDLKQDVFVRLFQKIGTFRGESTFSTWLYRFTVNQVLTHFRKLKVRPEEPFDEEPQRGSNRIPGSSDQISVIDRITIDCAVAQLAPGYRKVFRLHDVEGYEHKEVAQILGISEGASKAQLHRARRKLRNLINQQAALN